MIRYTHMRERAFKRMSFFFSVFLSLFLWENFTFVFLSPIPLLLYYEYLYSSMNNSEIIFTENGIEYTKDLKKWRGIHRRILLFQAIVGFAGVFRPVYPNDTILLIVRVVVILIAILMIYWIDFTLSRIFEREREYIWDFALHSFLVVSFLTITLTDQFNYFYLLWNIVNELAVFFFYWGFKRRLMIMARYSEND